ncbi:GreA/GreB family elongation factor [Croceitalea dokdonensis]|nr:GreA/GreB family elongation factor [Croceitalea dokdonensis]
MKHGNLVFSAGDFLMIKKYQKDFLVYEDYSHKNSLDLLNEHMLEAMVLEANDMPSHIVQMYAHITVKCTLGWEDTFQLVAPCEENIKENKVSVISSLGASVIGLAEGDKVTIGLPGSRIHLTITNVQQAKSKVIPFIPKEELKKLVLKRKHNLLTLNM